MWRNLRGIVEKGAAQKAENAVTSMKSCHAGEQKERGTRGPPRPKASFSLHPSSWNYSLILLTPSSCHNLHLDWTNSFGIQDKTLLLT